DPIASKATVTRPANEDLPNFNRSWSGEFCASGTLRFKYVVGAVVRPSGGAAIATTVIADDPVESTFGVDVANRSGSEWTAGLKELPEGKLVKPISQFEDTGEHGWNIEVTESLQATDAIKTGPNRGCKYLRSAKLTFVSSPRINAILLDPQDKFW